MLTPVARRRTAVASLALLVPLLSGCGIGFGAQTDQVYQPAVGVNETSGTVDVLGAVIVASGEGEGTFVASFANADKESDDRLVAVTGDDVEAEVLAPVEIGSDNLLNLADTGAVSVSGERVSEGNFVRLELEFQNGQKTMVNVPVVADGGVFDDITPARPGQARPSATATE